MNLQAYLKGCDRGDFQWECVESGTYGDGNSVDVENSSLEGRSASVTRHGNDSYEAEVDNLQSEPYYDMKEFTSRRSARNWTEKMIRKDINNNHMKNWIHWMKGVKIC